MKSLQEMIQEIYDTGLSQGDIALRVGTSQSTINRILKRNSEPHYSVGYRIVHLHSEIVPPEIVPSEAECMTG